MSDTHSLYHYIKFQVPAGDIFIHAGNFTAGGKPDEVVAFNEWLGHLPHTHKLVIAGNHELSFDPSFNFDLSPSSSKHQARSGLFGQNRSSDQQQQQPRADDIRKLLTNCTYLEDTGVELFGIKFFGTPWQPEFGPWAFGVPRGEQLLQKWHAIPANTDILITHTPPVGFCDRTARGEHSGCVELLTTIQERVRPRYSIFGHVHDAHGVMTDGRTVFINASTCDINYKPNNSPVVFDIERKDEVVVVNEVMVEVKEEEGEKEVVEKRSPWLLVVVVGQYFGALLRRVFGFMRRF
jgi:predicted phosphodiesterase